MKPLHLSISVFAVALLPLVALAQSAAPVIAGQPFSFSDVSVGAYTDSPWDQPTNVAVSALTRMGVLTGNPDGSFAPDRRLNRAEFVTIVMRLLKNTTPVSLNCFPDVQSTAWYAQDVCRAKALGLIRGNALPGVAASQWRFEPTRDIQYEEAVKILVGLYALPISGDTEGTDWYVPYIHAAQNADVDINGLVAGSHITRGQMARLTIGFVAESQNRLAELRNAETSTSVSSASSSRSSSHSSAVSSSSHSSSRASSFSSEGAVTSHILILGTTSDTLASTDLFSNLEPVDVNGVTVTFASPVQSIASLLIYDGSGTQIGTASAVNGSTSQFHGTIAFSKLILPYRQERTVFVKARLKSRDEGGISGETVQVQTITVDGTGRWSNEAYTSSSTETFSISQTAFSQISDTASIMAFTNNGPSQGVLVPGQQKILADFTVSAHTPDSQHRVRIINLHFTAGTAGGVVLSNLMLRNEDNSASTACSYSDPIISCDSIDPSIGTIDTTTRMRLIGDISIPQNATNPLLQISINDPGTPSTPGDILWSDGSTTFTWVDLDQPVLNATVWR